MNIMHDFTFFRRKGRPPIVNLLVSYCLIVFPLPPTCQFAKIMKIAYFCVKHVFFVGPLRWFSGSSTYRSVSPRGISICLLEIQFPFKPPIRGTPMYHVYNPNPATHCCCWKLFGTLHLLVYYDIQKERSCWSHS